MVVSTSVQALECPQCAGAVNVMAGQRCCECGSCGGKFAVSWLEAQGPQLVAFSDILQQQAASMRRQLEGSPQDELRGMLAEAQRQVKAAEAQQEQARLAYRELCRRVLSAVSPPQNATYATGLLSVVVWFLVVFFLENREWYLGLLAGVLLLVLGRGFYRRWRRAEMGARTELLQARQAVEAAEARLSEAIAVLQSRALEEELHQAAAAAWETARGLAPSTI